MRKEKRIRSPGFTLVELMIVSAIIGILAGIASIKFADLIWKAREARFKGTLGAIRSSLTIYYAGNEGRLPNGTWFTTEISENPKYHWKLPIKAAGLWDNHPLNLDFPVSQSCISVVCYNGVRLADIGRIYYFVDPAEPFGEWHGKLHVVCLHNDSSGKPWSLQ